MAKHDAKNAKTNVNTRKMNLSLYYTLFSQMKPKL